MPQRFFLEGFEVMKKYIVSPETARMIALQHPWVLADRHTKNWQGVKCGELALLCDEEQKPLATALLDPVDRVVARIVGDPGVQLDAGWFRNLLQKAKRLREQAGLEETDVYRLVNAEGDGLPGLTVDCYAGYLIVQLYTPAWDSYLPLLSRILQELFAPAGIYRKLRPQETRQLEAKGGGLKSGKEYSRIVWGKTGSWGETGSGGSALLHPRLPSFRPSGTRRTSLSSCHSGLTVEHCCWIEARSY